MSNISTITYNGSIIAQTEEDDNIIVTYDGKTIANVGVGETKTLLCANKGMNTNLTIGSKTLLCKLKEMATNVIINVATPTAYAVYSETDNSLTFYKTTDTITEGLPYRGKAATAVYTGFEDGSRPWSGKASSITSVTVADEGIAPTSTVLWFNNFNNCTSMDLAKLDTSNVTSMFGMFASCQTLKSLDLSKFNTQNVTNIDSFASKCDSLTEIILGPNFGQEGHPTSGIFYVENYIETTITGANSFMAAYNWVSDNRMYVGVTSATLSYPEKVEVGKTANPTLTINPSNYTQDGTTVTYSITSGSSYASVNSSTGVVTGKAAGTATIKVTIVGANGKTTTASVNITVVDYRFNVTYNPNGGKFGSSTANNTVGYKVNTSGEPTVTSGTYTEPSKEGYNFAGWYTNSACTNGNEFDITDITEGNNQTYTVYAKWNIKLPIAYAVYSADDGSFTFYKTTDTITEGSTYNGKTATAVYTGFETDVYNNYADTPWHSYRKSITSVMFVDEIAPISMSCWFAQFENCTSIDLAKLDTSNVTKMTNMFYGCKTLTSLDVSNFNTTKVTNMKGLFGFCLALNTLKFGENWSTENVIDMSNMFYNCKTLTLDCSGWNVDNVTKYTSFNTFAKGIVAPTWVN